MSKNLPKEFGHTTPLTGREMRCTNCRHWYVEIRQFHNVHEEGDHVVGTCPGCGTVNDLAALRAPKTGSQSAAQ